MVDSDENLRIAHIAREVVTRLAPQELPLFAATSAAYFEDPQRPIVRRHADDDIVGSGLDIPFMTPTVLAVATVVVRFVWEAIEEPIKEQIRRLLSDVFRRLVNAITGASAKARARVTNERGARPALSRRRIEQARHRAFVKARELDVSAEAAALLADAVIQSLVRSGG